MSQLNQPISNLNWATAGQIGGGPKKGDERDWLQIAEYFCLRARRVPIKKAVIFALDLARHWKAMLPLLRAPVGGNLHRLVAAYPEILFMASGPYLAENWDARNRFARIVDHCKTVAAIGGIVDFPPNAKRDLCRLTPIDPRYRLVLHQPREYVWEGQLDLSLYNDTQNIFSLRFCLSSEGGVRIAYIGALQGRPQKAGEPNIIDIYNSFCKAATRMRPRDFMIEAFQMLCRALDVTEIRAVADHNKPRRCFKRSYDEDWRARGGDYDGNGFFILPVIARRRTEEEMPAKKKAMYRNRYAMLTRIETEIGAGLQSRSMRSGPQFGLAAQAA
jgi:uncharacterized protein